LTNVYLYQKSWAEAGQMATNLIESGEYLLMTTRFGVEMAKPGTPWTDLFLDGNINRWQGNKEMIWAIQVANEYLTKGNSQYIKVSWLSQYNKVVGMTNSMANWQRGKAYLRASPYYLNLFNPADHRGSEYAIKRTWTFNDAALIQARKNAGNPLTQVVNGVTVEVNVGDTVVITPQNAAYLYPVPTKYMDVLGTSLSEEYSDKDMPFMRLAETYLFRAEARLHLGDLTGAADDINILRRRANAPEITSADVNIDLILDERAREMMCEENRRFTLMRTGKLIERNQLYNPKAKNNIAEKHYLFPIPQAEIDRMKDSPDFPQNPGY
jgi:hypothetical protein